MEAVVFILIFVVLWAWIEIIRSKEAFRNQIASLVNRIYKLEKELESLRQGTRDAGSRLINRTRFRLRSRRRRSCRCRPGLKYAVPPPIPAFAAASVSAPPVPPPFTPPLPRPVPAQPKTSQDWEALIGGNILNKIGALVLVVGIMTGLAYYRRTEMGPAGRDACAVLVSLALLGSGVWLERKETYPGVRAEPDRRWLGRSLCDSVRDLRPSPPRASSTIHSRDRSSDAPGRGRHDRATRCATRPKESRQSHSSPRLPPWRLRPTRFSGWSA